MPHYCVVYCSKVYESVFVEAQDEDEAVELAEALPREEYERDLFDVLVEEAE